MKFKFNYNEKSFEVDVRVCKSILSKASGLMFRKNSKPLLFVFNRLSRQPIHSFFCSPFVAVWFNDNNIVEIKIIKSWRFSVKPKEKFDKLLEIPKNNKNFRFFTDGKENI